jgi:hypothetical protein
MRLLACVGVCSVCLSPNGGRSEEHSHNQCTGAPVPWGSTAVQGPWATPVWQQVLQHGLKCHYDPEVLRLAQQGMQQLQLSL